MLRNYTPAFNVKLDKIMAITDLQISEELQTGAPSIKYRGNEGPQSPQEEQQMVGQDYSSPQYRMKLIEKLMQQGLDFGAASNEADRLIKLMLDRQRQGSAEGGRAEYGLGSIVRKITRPIKKIAKSPIGKAALLYAGTAGLGNLAGGLAGTHPWMSGKWLAPSAVKAGLFGKALPKGFQGPGMPGILNKWGLTKTAGSMMPTGKGALAALMAVPFTGMGMGKQESLGDIAGMDDLKFDFNYDDMIAEVKAAVSSGDVEEIKRVNLKYGLDLVEDTDVYAAKGGRIGYYSGGQSIPSKNSLEDARKTAMQDRLGGITEVMKLADLYRQGDVGQMYAAQGGRIGYKDAGGVRMASAVTGGEDRDIAGEMWMRLDKQTQSAYGSFENYFKSGDWIEGVKQIDQGWAGAQGGRIKAQEGGIMDLGGMEKDYRNTGGFVDLGAEEKADDVPARLSVNEFVMTADAVRGAGGGDIDKGAEIMESVMKNLEEGGRISEESQGLTNRRQGASDMFEVSERLSEVV